MNSLKWYREWEYRYFHLIGFIDCRNMGGSEYSCVSILLASVVIDFVYYEDIHSSLNLIHWSLYIVKGHLVFILAYPKVNRRRVIKLVPKDPHVFNNTYNSNSIPWIYSHKLFSYHFKLTLCYYYFNWLCNDVIVIVVYWLSW